VAEEVAAFHVGVARAVRFRLQRPAPRQLGHPAAELLRVEGVAQAEQVRQLPVRRGCRGGGEAGVVRRVRRIAEA
jgi:hypothetical protein